MKGRALYHLIAVAGLYIAGRCAPAVAQVYQELYSFNSRPDGAIPHGGLVEGQDGYFYGTTFYGGLWDKGTVFKINQGAVLTIIASFDGTNGSHPDCTLLLASDGNFYGTDWRGDGFRVTAGGTLTSFIGGATAGDLVQGTNGYIHGVIAGDDTYYGWIFRTSLDGQSWQSLHQFTYDRATQDGIDPEGGLVQSRDGNFYGTTSGGGAYGCGTVYKITAAGQFTTLASFNNTNCGATYPYGRLLEGSDGNFYGAANGCSVGTIFRVTPQGTLTTLYLFDCTSGEYPNGGLIEANDGFFYGTAPYCGLNSYGAAFRMTQGGNVSPLFAFTGGYGAYPGATPYAGLVQGRDGNLYGTTGNQGTHGAGNVFRIVMPGPQLNSFRAAQQFVLSWRTNYSGFKLQSSTNPASATWLDSTNQLTVVGRQFFITNSMSGGAQFFRLKK